MTTLPEAASLMRQLARPEQANLIRVAGIQPELAYIFRHALVQESAYQSLVPRPELHQRPIRRQRYNRRLTQ